MAFDWCETTEGDDFWNKVYYHYDVPPPRELPPIPEAGIKVRLNKEYTALFSSKGIKVGCQEISWEKIEKLMKVKKEMDKMSVNNL